MPRRAIHVALLWYDHILCGRKQGQSAKEKQLKSVVLLKSRPGPGAEKMFPNHQARNDNPSMGHEVLTDIFQDVSVEQSVAACHDEGQLRSLTSLEPCFAGTNG
jgi:hypothetical protein